MCIYFCVVRSFKKENFLKNLRSLSCFIKLKSIFNLLCASDPKHKSNSRDQCNWHNSTPGTSLRFLFVSFLFPSLLDIFCSKLKQMCSCNTHVLYFCQCPSWLVFSLCRDYGAQVSFFQRKKKKKELYKATFYLSTHSFAVLKISQTKFDLLCITRQHRLLKL